MEIRDDTLYDLTGVNHARVSGGVTVAPADGYQGAGLRFDGSGVLTIPDHETLSFAAGFRVDVAAKLAEPLSDEVHLIEKAGDYRLSLVPSPQGARASFTIETAEGPVSVTSGETVPVGPWVSLSGRYTQGEIVVVVGASMVTAPLALPPLHGPTRIEIGAGFVGGLDAIRVFDLSRGPLSTFANGQQALDFVADETGRFSAAIVSTGRHPGPPSAGLGSYRTGLHAGGGAEHATASDPGLSERVLGVWFTEIETWIEERGERSSTVLGYGSARLLAFTVKILRGFAVGSANNDDLAVIAGDVLGSIIPVTFWWPNLRDFINACARLIHAEADTLTVVDFATGLLYLAGSVVKGRGRVLVGATMGS